MYILDTCSLLWLVAGDDNLSQSARNIIGGEAGLYISAISSFEIALKHTKNRITLPFHPQAWYHRAIKHHGITEIAASGDILVAAALLAPHHNDPSDRIIIATAMKHDLTILSPDELIKQYEGVKVIW